ncbi:methyl-accepting chemotaxis protein [Paenibacillus sp. sgz302251]|uniref:methyl-accepting chemotaxis protein n=1 Tax=Paenibacillus sp. sgz302251 TaxID=3414493 RepID=UPI003C7B3D9E
MKRGIGIKLQLMAVNFVILATVLLVMFFISYQSAKNEVLDVAEEMFENVLKDTIGLMDSYNEQVKAGNMSLQEAQEMYRTHAVGPKTADGSRDISQTKMSQNDYMFFWAFQLDGVMTMHADAAEGQNLWDYQVGDKYTVRDTWANPNLTGQIVREIWQNPNEPVYTYIAYQDYYEPWGWIVGAGGREEIIYSTRLDALQQKFLIATIIALLASLVVSYLFAHVISSKINKLRVAIGKAGEGDFREHVDIKFKDEFGLLANDFNRMSESLRTMLKEVAHTSERLSASSTDLSNGAEQTSRATEHIASTVEQVAAGTEEQVRGVQETSNVLNNISQSLTTVSDNIQKISENSLVNLERANSGASSIQSAEKQMDSIQNIVNVLSVDIQALGERSQEIGNIVEVITGIAAQTNLLALNAAIEAARAGEHGRGFAVVANEVRKLSEQSADSAQQITELIVQIQNQTNSAMTSMNSVADEVKHGLEVVQSSGQSFYHIRDQINNASAELEHAASRIQQMTTDTVKVAQSISDITRVLEESAASTQSISAATEEQLASMEEISSSSRMLDGMAEQLTQEVKKFKIEA